MAVSTGLIGKPPLFIRAGVGRAVRSGTLSGALPVIAVVLGAAGPLSANAGTIGTRTRVAVHAVIRVDTMIKGAQVVPVAGIKGWRTPQFGFINVQH